ncbi:hypothetical protein [Fodinicola acaciae]|uniref:hypothetical protein n=1 Tax=Fodinicola acaciae TaxID=2681555 RepID=UPI0013D1B65B|nr:hypothetical protein [Fodinicola acaciae]
MDIHIEFPANSRHARTVLWARAMPVRLRAAVMGAVFALIGLACYTYLWFDHDSDVQPVGTAFMIVGLIVATVPLVSTLRAWLRLSRIPRRWLYHLTDEEIAVSTPSATSRFAWTGVRAARRTGATFRLHLFGGTQVVLPAAAMAPADVAELETFLINRKLAGAK